MPHPNKSLLYLLAIYFCFICTVPFTAAQTLSPGDYTVLRSYGTMPADFIEAAQKVNADYSANKSRSKQKSKARGQDKFEIVQEYGLNEMFMSGSVVYGDAIGTYVNRVADSLLAAFPGLRKELRFYVTKSDAANAYSTDKGIIFINIGLIARLRNEAQLAYVIAHEIVHYIKQHNIRIFLEKEKAFGRKKKITSYRYYSFVDRLLAVNFRSKEMETEADMVALRNYFSRSHYDLDAVPDVFNALLYSAYPFTNQLFDLSLLETRDMVFPDKYLVDDVDTLRVSEDQADSLSTHPNVRIRKQGIRRLIDSLAMPPGKQYLQPAQQFNNIVMLARFEVIRQLLIDHRLAEALFCSSAMLEQFPDNKFLKKCFAAALGGLSTYKTHSITDESQTAYRDVVGEIKQVNFLINRISCRDLNIIALQYVWRCHHEYPEDDYLAQLTRELFHDLVFENSVKQGYFYTKTLDELKFERQKATVEDTAADAGRTKRKKHTRENKIDSTFTKFAFVDLLKNEQFKNDIDLYYAKKDSVQQTEETRNNSYYSFRRGSNKNKDGGKQITRFLMVDPYVVKQDNRRLDNVQYLESELNRSRIRDLMVKNADIAGIDMQMIDAKGIDSAGTAEFNEMALVNEYVSERMHQNGNGEVLSVCKENIDSIMQRGNSPYLGWSAVVSMQEKKKVSWVLLLSVIPYMLPYVIYEIIAPNIHTYYYNILFDVKTGKMVIKRLSVLRAGLRADQLNAHIYDFMYSIKKSYE
jgi:beta-barrel assembly-enhancing protease